MSTLSSWWTVASMPEDAATVLGLTGKNWREMVVFLRMVRVRLIYVILHELKDDINQFWDNVFLMDEDQEQREANLALMQEIASIPDGVADFSQLQGF